MIYDTSTRNRLRNPNKNYAKKEALHLCKASTVFSVKSDSHKDTFCHKKPFQ